MKEPAERDLKKRTYSFARRIIKLYRALPRDTVAQILGKQVLRSGTSVGANYCEAFRGRSRAEFAAKMGECLRELDETSYWLNLLIDEAIVSPKKLAALLDETNQLIAIFVTILNKTRNS